MWITSAKSIPATNLKVHLSHMSWEADREISDADLQH